MAKADVIAALGDLTGIALPFTGSTAPTGTVLANGQTLSRTTYANLWAFAQASGNIAASDAAWQPGQYSPGDGSTTFRVPDMSGRTVVGAGTGTQKEVLTSVTAASNAVAVPSNNNKWITGMQAALTGVSGFTGLTNGTYYVIRDTATTVKFATSLANAQNGTVVTVTGTGSLTMTHTYTTRTLGELGGEEAHAMSITELLAHTHTPGGGGNNASNAAGAPGTSASGSTGGNAGMNNMQPFVAQNWVIISG